MVGRVRRDREIAAAPGRRRGTAALREVAGAARRGARDRAVLSRVAARQLRMTERIDPRGAPSGVDVPRRGRVQVRLHEIERADGVEAKVCAGVGVSKERQRRKGDDDGPSPGSRTVNTSPVSGVTKSEA
jgi:hypothetical protein